MTEPNAAFTIAAVRFEVHGPPDVIRFLQELYDCFPEPSGSEEKSVVLRWEGNRCVLNHGGPPVSVERPEMIAAISVILIGRALRQLRPELLVLHGNAIRSTGAGRVLLLTGGSGSGKTTLSRLLISTGEFQLVAEDVLLLNTDDRTVIPFPRAASIRGAESGIPWMGLSGRGEGKRLAAQEGAACALPASLADARVIVLRKSGAKPKASLEGEQIWISSLSEQLEQAIRDARLPLCTVRSEGGFPALTAQAPLLAEQWKSLAELLRQHESVVLRASAPEAEATKGSFLPQPELKPIGAAEALPELLVNLIRYGDEPEPQGRALMSLTRLFSRAELWELRPGGTPEETAAMLRGLVKARRSRPKKSAG